MLFSEPKIPQSYSNSQPRTRPARFSALQRAENSSILRAAPPPWSPVRVSVLFSEPKIPQCSVRDWRVTVVPCFSALQRAENSSIHPDSRTARAPSAFQCSSASRKFLNAAPRPAGPVRQTVSVLFSEPKIPQCVGTGAAAEIKPRFQCSSASRKFLNLAVAGACRLHRLFQCSSASRKFLNAVGDNAGVAIDRVSVLFSEPKIPQCCCSRRATRTRSVSVLFSEPKIPQFDIRSEYEGNASKFQCSSASRKFLN